MTDSRDRPWKEYEGRHRPYRYRWCMIDDEWCQWFALGLNQTSNRKEKSNEDDSADDE